MDKKKINWWLNSASGGILAEYQAILDEATSLGLTLPVTTQTADQDFIQAGLTQGWWAKLDWLGMFAYNDTNLAAFATLNWKAPTLYRMTESALGGISYGVKGYKNVIATGDMITNFNLATNGVNYLQDSASRGCYIETAPTSGLGIDGNASGVVNMMQYANSTVQRINQGTTSLTGGAVDLSGTGYTAINRSSSLALQFYKVTTQSDRTATSASISSALQRIGRFGTGGSLDRSDMEFGCYYMGGSLTQTEHGQFNTAIETRRTAIGL